jgi:hypothetical protein
MIQRRVFFVEISLGVLREWQGAGIIDPTPPPLKGAESRVTVGSNTEANKSAKTLFALAPKLKLAVRCVVRT